MVKANKDGTFSGGFGLGWALQFMVEGGKVSSDRLSNPGSYYFYEEGRFFLFDADEGATKEWTPRKKKLSWAFRVYNPALSAAMARVSACEAALSAARAELDALTA